jgi:hypothetical protein
MKQIILYSLFFILYSLFFILQTTAAAFSPKGALPAIPLPPL